MKQYTEFDHRVINARYLCRASIGTTPSALMQVFAISGDRQVILYDTDHPLREAPGTAYLPAQPGALAWVADRELWTVLSDGSLQNVISESATVVRVGRNEQIHADTNRWLVGGLALTEVYAERVRENQRPLKSDTSARHRSSTPLAALLAPGPRGSAILFLTDQSLLIEYGRLSSVLPDIAGAVSYVVPAPDNRTLVYLVSSTGDLAIIAVTAAGVMSQVVKSHLDNVVGPLHLMINTDDHELKITIEQRNRVRIYSLADAEAPAFVSERLYGETVTARAVNLLRSAASGDEILDPTVQSYGADALITRAEYPVTQGVYAECLNGRIRLYLHGPLAGVSLGREELYCPAQIRLLEDGTWRLLEDNSLRLLEAALAPVTFSLDGGLNLTLSGTGTNIRYTLDGSTPTTTTGLVYGGPIPLSDFFLTSGVVKALTYNDDGCPEASPVVTYNYVAEVLALQPPLYFAPFLYGPDGTPSGDDTGIMLIGTSAPAFNFQTGVAQLEFRREDEDSSGWPDPPVYTRYILVFDMDFDAQTLTLNTGLSYYEVEQDTLQIEYGQYEALTVPYTIVNGVFSAYIILRLLDDEFYIPIGYPPANLYCYVGPQLLPYSATQPPATWTEPLLGSVSRPCFAVNDYGLSVFVSFSVGVTWGLQSFGFTYHRITGDLYGIYGDPDATAALYQNNAPSTYGEYTADYSLLTLVDGVFTGDVPFLLIPSGSPGGYEVIGSPPASITVHFGG